MAMYFVIMNLSINLVCLRQLNLISLESQPQEQNSIPQIILSEEDQHDLVLMLFFPHAFFILQPQFIKESVKQMMEIFFMIVIKNRSLQKDSFSLI